MESDYEERIKQLENKVKEYEEKINKVKEYEERIKKLEKKTENMATRDDVNESENYIRRQLESRGIIR